MGAANVIAAFHTYGRKLGDHAMRLLAYMAAVSKDADAEPWCGLGHAALSELALGRTLPPESEPRRRLAAIRSVERAVAELAAVGAVRTVRRATFGRRGMTPARYRLYLTEPCPPHAERVMTTTRSASGGSQSTTRSASRHHTLSVAPPHAQRVTEDYEETRGAITTGVLQSTREVEGSTDADANGSRRVGMCTRCRELVPLTASGLIRTHGRGRSRCPGSLKRQAATR